MKILLFKFEPVISNQNEFDLGKIKDMAEINRLEDKLMETLKKAVKTGDPAGKIAQKSDELHVADERFKEYYDQEQEGIAEFLRDAILIYTDSKKN